MATESPTAGSPPARRARRPEARVGVAGRAFDVEGAIQAGVLGAVALLVRLIGLDHPVFVDELNHVLAARSVLADGTYYVVGQEPYYRAWVFTRVVAAFFALLGESITAARLPALLAGTALVVFMFLWVRRLAGGTAAWVAGLLLCFDPFSLYLSQLARFYTFQALAFWAGAACLYHVVEEGRPLRETAALAIAGILLLNLAKHFSSLSMIGWIGVAAGFTLANSRQLIRWLREARLHALLGGVVALAGLALAGWWVRTGVVEYVSYMFNYTDLWALERKDYIRYYHDYLQSQYGTVWSILPIAGLVAVLARPRPTLYWGGIFGTALVLHSLAAWKVERYLFYAMPGFFAVTGIASAVALEWLHHRIRPLTPGRGRLAGILAAGILVLVIAATVRFGWGVNGAFHTSTRILTSDARLRPYPYARSDWAAVRPYLQATLDSGAVVVASSNLKSLYFLGRLDYDLAAEHLHNINGVQPEFSVLGKTTRPVLSKAASVERLMACHAHGLIVIEKHHWGREWAVPQETADFIARSAEPVPLPTELELIAYRWRSAGQPGPCPGLPRP